LWICQVRLDFWRKNKRLFSGESINDFLLFWIYLTFIVYLWLNLEFRDISSVSVITPRWLLFIHTSVRNWVWTSTIILSFSSHSHVFWSHLFTLHCVHWNGTKFTSDNKLIYELVSFYPFILYHHYPTALHLFVSKALFYTAVKWESSRWRINL
jgi:hypothetical protein